MMKKILKLMFWSVCILISQITFSNALEKTKVTIALARNTITAAEENYTYAVPKQLGYFSHENLDVEILPTDGSTAAIQAVVSGSADIAYASSANIAAAIDKGVALKAFAGLTIEWPYYIAVEKNSAIKTIKDLKGKRIGVISLASASYADLVANLRLEGLEPEDVVIIPVGAGARAAAALKAGQVDAIDSYSDSFVIMEQNGVLLSYLKRPDVMNKLFSVTMVTRQDLLQEKPEILAAFARSAYKGIIYTKLYPQSALELSFKEFPQLAGYSDPKGEEAKKTKEAMQVALGYTIPKNNDDVSKWGHWLDLPSRRWEAVLQFAHVSGLTTKELNVPDVWCSNLMDEIYSFDVSDIKQQ